MDLPFEQFPALSAIGICRHVFIQRIPGIDVSHDKAEVLERLDAAHREIRNESGMGDWPLVTAQQIHGNKIAVVDSLTQFQSRFPRLSPLEKGEDEGEGFEQFGSGLTLTLPLSLRKGEATQQTHGRSKISARE